MDAVADLAEDYSHDEIRVSHEQNLILPHVALDDLPAVYDRLASVGLADANAGLISDIIACPGLDYCALATARSIPVAQRIARAFRRRRARARAIGPLKIKISGCINACGHHHVGHIGILGLERAGEETYQITLGGSGDENAAIGQIVGPGFSSENVVDAVETIVETYMGLRRGEEETSSTAFRRVGLAPFKEALYERSGGSDLNECSAGRGSASTNAATEPTSNGASGTCIRCARRTERTSTSTIDMTANAPGMLARKRSTSEPVSTKTTRPASATSNPPKPIGSDSRRPSTAGAVPKRRANGATRSSSQLNRSTMGGSESSDDCLDSSDDRDIVDVDWLHGTILRLQPDPAGLAIERLNRRFTIDHRDDDLSVLRGRLRLDDDQIAVEDRGIDHRVALDAQHERALATTKLAGSTNVSSRFSRAVIGTPAATRPTTGSATVSGSPSRRAGGAAARSTMSAGTSARGLVGSRRSSPRRSSDFRWDWTVDDDDSPTRSPISRTDGG